MGQGVEGFQSYLIRHPEYKTRFILQKKTSSRRIAQEIGFLPLRTKRLLENVNQENERLGQREWDEGKGVFLGTRPTLAY